MVFFYFFFFVSFLRSGQRLLLFLFLTRHLQKERKKRKEKGNPGVCAALIPVQKKVVRAPLQLRPCPYYVIFRESERATPSIPKLHAEYLHFFTSLQARPFPPNQECGERKTAAIKNGGERKRKRKRKKEKQLSPRASLFLGETDEELPLCLIPFLFGMCGVKIKYRPTVEREGAIC